MNTILNRLDRLMLAITFAEANEAELAQDFLTRRKAGINTQAPQITKMTGGQILPTQTAH